MSSFSVWSLISSNFGTFVTALAGVVATIATTVITISSNRKKNKTELQTVINDSFKILAEKLNQRIADQDEDIAKYRTESHALLKRIEDTQEEIAVAGRQIKEQQRLIYRLERHVERLTDFIRKNKLRVPQEMREELNSEEGREK